MTNEDGGREISDQEAKMYGHVSGLKPGSTFFAFLIVGVALGLLFNGTKGAAMLALFVCAVKFIVLPVFSIIVEPMIEKKDPKGYQDYLEWEKRKTRNKYYGGGFIQIPLLIGVIVGMALVSGVGYIAARQIAQTAPPTSTSTPEVISGASTAETAAEETDIAEPKKSVAVVVQTPSIQPQTTTPSPTSAPVVTQQVNNTSRYYQDGKSFADTIEKVFRQDLAGRNFDTQYSKALSAGNAILAEADAKSAVDAYDAAYKLMLDTTVPFALPSELQDPMIQIRSLYLERLLLRKQIAHIEQSVAEDMKDGLASQASRASIDEMTTLHNKEVKLYTNWQEIFSKWLAVLEQYNA